MIRIEKKQRQGKHISDMSKKEKIQWAISLGIKNPESLKLSKLNAVILAENIKLQLRNFSSGGFQQSSF